MTAQKKEMSETVSELLYDWVKPEVIDYIWASFIDHQFKGDAKLLDMIITQKLTHRMVSKVVVDRTASTFYINVGRRFKDEERTVVKDFAVFNYEYLRSAQGREAFDQRIVTLDEKLWDLVPPHLKDQQ